MAGIAGLQDFRGQGTPKDMGAFVQPCTVNVFLDAGIYYGVSWSGGVLVGSNASLRTVTVNTLTYLAGLGGGSIFYSLIGAHTFGPTVTVSVDGVSFFGLGKSTILQMGAANVVSFFEVEADDVTFQNIAFDGNKGAVVWPGGGEVDTITVQAGSVRTLIMSCYFYNWGTVNSHPIEVKTVGVQREVVVANCNFVNCDSYTVAFASAGGHCIAYGCTVVNSGGFEVAFGSYNVFANNTFRGLSGTQAAIILSFTLCVAIGNTFDATNYVIINADDCAVIGNVLKNTTYGITVQGDDDALIVGNTIIGNTGINGAIRLQANSDRATILSNRIGDCDRGVRIDDATVVDTIIFNNNFAGTTTPVYFAAGTPTIIVPTLVLPFVQGTTFLSADGAAWGWEIDAATEYAIALGHLPSAVQQVLYVKIMAVSLVLEADAMRLEINGYGGASNEPFSQETIAVANKPSATTNFAANDYVYWLLSKTDDADIGHLLGGDSIMFKVLYEAAGDGDCTTDAVFLCAVIEYV